MTRVCSKCAQTYVFKKVWITNIRVYDDVNKMVNSDTVCFYVIAIFMFREVLSSNPVQYIY
jgi:hypothetical protein